MVEGKGKLVIDLGNSETRVGVQFGKNATLGTPRSRIRTLSNGYSAIQESAISILMSSGNYDEKTSRVFKIGEGYYCNGEIADTEYGMSITRPSALIQKYKSAETMKAVANALCQGIMEVADMNGAELDDINVSWDVFVLLPPGHIEERVHTDTGTVSGAEFLARHIKALNEINFLLPKLHVDVDIESVTVFPEGHCAFMAVLFEHKGKIREGYKDLVTSPTIIIDIGAGTSDICVVENGKTIINTRHTANYGGNNVHAKVADLLKADGIQLYDSDVRKGTVSGYVMDGAKKVRIERKIDIAKQQVANLLVNDIQRFFEAQGYPPQKLAKLLVCGGGAEKAESEKIIPLGNYIDHYMKQLSPNIENVEYPEVEINGEMVQISPRLLNIYGAMILAE